MSWKIADVASRVGRAALAAVCAAALTGCTVTVAGGAVKARGDRDAAIVALMDTGTYPTTVGQLPGNAGADRSEQARAEVERMAPFVTGPWQVDTALVNQDFLASAKMVEPYNVAAALSYPMGGDDNWPNPIGRAAAAHGFIAGLSTGRTGSNGARLQNAVLLFPDPKAAADAGAEMAAVTPPIQFRPVSVLPEPTSSPQNLDSAWQPGACAEFSSSSVHPDIVASADLGDRVVLRSFTAHGSYLLYQFVIGRRVEVCGTVMQTLSLQNASLDRFVPTDPAKMADLPLDPSGFLWARTLWESASTRTPWSAGVWPPDAWLRFTDDDPVKTAALFNAAGVRWVSQRLTTVYEARDAAGAARLTDQFVADTRALPGVHPVGASVPGFPAAQCFSRTNWKRFKSAIMVANQHVWWHFKCVARAGRYAFTAFADQEQDVNQQISAQYRILAGE
jgi:hypothetical protein